MNCPSLCVTLCFRRLGTRVYSLRLPGGVIGRVGVGVAGGEAGSVQRRCEVVRSDVRTAGIVDEVEEAGGCGS